MGEGTEIQPAGRVSGILGSIFRRRRVTAADVAVPVPPMPHRDELPPPNLNELNLIKQQVQGLSKQIAPTDAGIAAGPAPAEAQALLKNDIPSPAVPGAASPEKMQGSAPPRKSRLDELRDSIEESARRKGPAHLKKNLEQVNAHLSYVKRKSAVGDKKLARLVDETIREELGKMGASVKQKLASNPRKAEREMLEDFQRQILGLMDVSDRKSQLELEQVRSQMDGLRKQISAIPDILVQKEIDELSPLKEEVVVLRGELRKALPNVSDAGERAKLEGTLARVEAISKVFEQNPRQDAMRSELEGMRAQLGSISAAIEKSREFEAGVDAKSVLEFDRLKGEMEELKRRVQAIPAVVEAAESKGMDSIKNTISGVRSSVQHLADEEKKLESVGAQMDTLQRRIDGLSRRVGSVLPEDFGSLRDELRSMRSSIRSILSSSRGKEERDLRDSLQKELNQVLVKGEERSAAEFGRLERNLSDVKKRISTIPSKIDEEKPELDALKKELQSLQSAVGTALSQPKTEEEAKLLRELQSHLDGLLEESESRSRKEFGALRGELADVRRKVVGIPLRVEAGSRPEFDAVRGEVLGLQKLVSDALSRPRDEDEKRLLLSLQSRLEGLLESGESRSLKEMEKLEGEISDVRASVSRIPSVVGARERPELEAIRGEVVGLQRMVSVELSKPRNEDEKRLLQNLQSRLEGLLSVSESRSEAEFGELRKELSDVRSSVSRIPSVVGAHEKLGLDAIRAEVAGLQGFVSDALSKPRNEEEKELLKGLQSRLESLMAVSESRSAAEFSDLKRELSDVRAGVSRIPGIVGARERPELEAIRGEVVGLQRFVSDALSRPKDEEEKRLLQNLQSRLEGLLVASESRSAAEFGELKKELVDVRSSVSRIPGIVGARERPELEAIRGEVVGLQRMVSVELSKPRNEEEKELLKGLQSRLESLMALSESRSTAEFGELRKELSDVRAGVSRIPSVVGAREKPELDAIHDEISSMQKAVSDALSRPKNEGEKRLLLSLQSRLEGLLEAGDSRSASGFGRMEEELSVIRNSISRIPSVVGARERYEFDEVKAELLGLKKAVSDALGRPLDEYQKNILQGLQSRLEGLLRASESRSVAELGKVEGELSDIRERVAGMPGLLVSREKADAGFIQTEIDGLKKVVAEALSKPRDEGERRFLKGLESRLEGLLEVSEENSLQHIGELRKEIGDVRKKISKIPSSVEAGEKPGIDSLREEVQSIRSAVESALAEPKNVEEKEMLRNVLAQLDSMVKFFDLKAGSALEAVKSKLDAINWQVAEVRAEKGDIGAIARDVHDLGASLKKAVSTMGRNDRHLVGKISEQIAAISDSLGSKAGSAAESIRGELEGMKAELVSAVSAEKPELESLKEEVEKAVAKRGNAGIEHELSSIRNQVTGMLQASEARTESGLKSGFASLQKTAGSDVPGGSLSDIRESISSLRELLEKRNYAPEARPSKARKKKAGKARSRGIVHFRKKPPAGRISGKGMANKKKQSTLRRSGESGARKKNSPERPKAARTLSKSKLSSERPETGKSLSRLRAALNDRSISRRGRSDLRSFLAQMEKRQKSRPKALPAIERRLGGRYATRGNSKKRVWAVPHERRIGDIGLEKRSAGLELDTGRDLPGEGRSRPEGGTEGRSILQGGSEGHRDLLRRDALQGEMEGPRRSALQEEREPADAKRREDAPGRRSGYENYLRDDKMGRIGSDVKRMHDRLKDIKRLYKEEF